MLRCVHAGTRLFADIIHSISDQKGLPGWNVDYLTVDHNKYSNIQVYDKGRAKSTKPNETMCQTITTLAMTTKAPRTSQTYDV